MLNFFKTKKQPVPELELNDTPKSNIPVIKAPADSGPKKTLYILACSDSKGVLSGFRSPSISNETLEKKRELTEKHIKFYEENLLNVTMKITDDTKDMKKFKISKQLTADVGYFEIEVPEKYIIITDNSITISEQYQLSSADLHTITSDIGTFKLSGKGIFEKVQQEENTSQLTPIAKMN